MDYLSVLIGMLVLLSSCTSNSEELEGTLSKEQKVKIIQLESETIVLATNKAEINELAEELELMLEDL